MSKKGIEIASANNTIANTKEVYEKKRVKGDKDLVKMIFLRLQLHAGEIAANTFIINSKINDVKDANPITQRIIINSYLVNLLLIFRANNKCNVTLILPYIVDGGTINDWLELLDGIVIPFIKEAKVYG